MSDVLGAIIAGGASTRFGSPKALVTVGGLRVVDRALNALREAPDIGDVIAIVNDADLAARIGIPYVGDRITGAGSLGGVQSALTEALERGYAGVFAVACDMPFLSADLIHALLAVRGDHDVVIPESGGPRGVEPLCAFYSIGCLPAIDRALARGDARMIGFHAEADVLRFPIATVRSFGDPAFLFMNLNTESDREAAERHAANTGTRASTITSIVRSADWLDIADALRIMLEHVSRCETEIVPLRDAHGRTLAEPVTSSVDQPPWDNSAMDGFAARSADVAGASPSSPVALEVIEDIPAGALPRLTLRPGQASRIMTGAPVPSGADGVIRIEHTQMADDTHVHVLDDVDAGRNVRYRGEDVRAGHVVMAAGRRLSAADIGVLAMIGCAHPVVTRRPRVALLATGNELVEPDRIDAVKAGTHIINSNTPALAAALDATDCSPIELGIARDDRTDLRERLGSALDCDALITTAGASVGDHDMVKDVIEELGGETVFWRVKIRPGSPFSFGILPRLVAGKGRTGRIPVFGLPGNPVSALVTFEILVRPVLRAMLGRASVYPRVEHAVAGEDIRSPAGLVRFLRVRLEVGVDGNRRVYLTGPQGSGILTSVAAADALMIVPIETDFVPAGTVVRVVPMRVGDAAQVSYDLTADISTQES